MLYGFGCGLSQAAWEVGTTILAADKHTVTTAEADLQPDGYYVGGILRLEGGGQRMITGHTGPVLTLSRSLDGLSPGKLAKISPGCDHSKAQCVDKFNNLVNFGGFPYIPLKNPFSGSSII